MATATLSLYRLDEELAELLDYRQERADNREDPASAEELEACDIAIREYMEQLPRKVDGVAAFIHFCEDQIAAADKQIARGKAHKAQAVANIERVKECAAVVLEKQPEPAKGCRKLVGQHSTLLLKGNGGVQPLVISQPELVPDELCVWRGEFSNEQWRRLMRTVELGEEWRSGEILDLVRLVTRVPSNSLIREALLQSCAACDGRGWSEQIEENPPVRWERTCSACGGSGKNAVPGAHLEPRGRSVVVK